MRPNFTKQIIAQVENQHGGYPMNTFLAVGDLNRDGRPDIVIGGREGRMVWLENNPQLPWAEHLIDAAVCDLECGGSLIDLTGNGYPDIIVGGGGGVDELWWWEHPGADGDHWQKRVILKSGATQFHDTLVGDAMNTGQPCLLATNQHHPDGTTIYCLPLPADPRVSPWPAVQIIASGKCEPLEMPDGTIGKLQPEEGLALGDVDGDGLNEVVAGCSWYKYDQGRWVEHRFASGYITNKIAIGDLDGDGRNEIVLSEGDPVIYGKTQGGRVGWFKPRADINEPWEEHTLEDGLLDAHTLLLADLCGQGRLDILVGEIGVASATRGYRRRPPWIVLYENLGDGQFTRHILDQGVGIHDGILSDLTGNGKLDLVCKPLHGPDQWNVLVFFNTPHTSQS